LLLDCHGAGSCIDEKIDSACFSYLGVARERLYQAKNRLLLGRRLSFPTEPKLGKDLQTWFTF